MKMKDIMAGDQETSVDTDAVNHETAESAMADRPPDRLCANSKSPHYDEALLRRGIGIRFNGVQKHNVEEYCVSEGWVRLTVGKTVDRFGNPMTVKYKGTVEPFFEDIAQTEK
jgi:hypothetical protein